MNAQLLDANIYTPTLTNVTNLDDSAAFECYWYRIGNVITVSGQFTADATAAAPTATELGLSLPIPTDLTSIRQLSGVASTGAGAQTTGARVVADTTNDRASIQWSATSTANNAWTFMFSYRLR